MTEKYLMELIDELELKLKEEHSGLLCYNKNNATLVVGLGLIYIYEVGEQHFYILDLDCGEIEIIKEFFKEKDFIFLDTIDNMIENKRCYLECE